MKSVTFHEKIKDHLDYGGLDERRRLSENFALISVSHMCTIKDNIPDANTKDFWAWSSRPKIPHFAL